MAEEKNVPETAENENKENKKQDLVAVPGTTVLESTLKAWKEQYKKVFVTDYMGQRYVWRRLTDEEFREVAKNTESIKDEDTLVAAREKEFCKLCTLYPDKEKVEKDMDDNLVSSKVAGEILYHSGFFPPRTIEL